MIYQHLSPEREGVTKQYLFYVQKMHSNVIFCLPVVWSNMLSVSLSLGSVFGLHLFLREISDTLAAKCSSANRCLVLSM